MSRGAHNSHLPARDDQPSVPYNQQANERLRYQPQTLSRRQLDDYNWHESAQERINIYAAVDSWRSYGGDQNNLQANYSGNTGFNPYAQAFQNYRQPYNSQTYGQQQPQPSPCCQPANIAQAHQASAPSYCRPSQPLRFSSGVHERQALQSTAQPLTQGGRHGPPTQHQVAYRPRGSGKGLNHARQFSTEKVYQSIEGGQDTLAIPPAGFHDSPRRGYGRQSTPRRQYTSSPPPTPCATELYLNQAKFSADLRKTPQKLLVVLDLNGTLLFKPDRRYQAKFHVRPGVPKLLDYLFKNHVVMIYTSSQPQNAKLVVNILFNKNQLSKLAGVWARDKLDLNQAQYKSKVQVFKRLDKIWKDKFIQSSCPGEDKWGQENTVLVDDSHLKALAQPHNLLQVPEYTSKPLTKQTPKAIYNAQQDVIMQGLILKLEELKLQEDVSRLIRQWQTGEANIPRVPGSDAFVDEKVDQKELAEKERADEAVVEAGEELAATQLATPKSPASEDEGRVILSKSKSPDTAAAPSTEQARKRSESPIPDSVWGELLAGRRKGEMKEAPDSMLTPESQDG